MQRSRAARAAPVLISMAPEYRVYWQPGCSSCLKAKEFLHQHGVAFQSINVRKAQGAADELRRLGARSVPVVARGDAFVLAQDLGELARFIGVRLQHRPLAPALLVRRLDGVLAAAQRYLPQVPGERLNAPLPGRPERTARVLGYHIFVIGEAFLDAMDGATLSYTYYERRPPDALATGAQLAAFGAGVRQRLQDWWAQCASPHLSVPIETYYGRRPAADVLERTAWHAAQHARQLQAVLEHCGILPDGPLGAAELAGLPLPERVWDDEVGMLYDSDDA